MSTTKGGANANPRIHSSNGCDGGFRITSLGVGPVKTERLIEISNRLKLGLLGRSGGLVDLRTFPLGHGGFLRRRDRSLWLLQGNGDDQFRAG